MNDQKTYAGFWTRWLAIFIDFLFTSAGVFVLLFLITLNTEAGLVQTFPILLWTFLYIFFINGLIWIFLNPYLISHFGGSLGKLITGLKIENEDGTPLTYKQALFREYVAKFASNALLGAGYYWIFKTPKKQGWHDMLSDTVVIKHSNGLVTGLLVFAILTTIEVALLLFSVNNLAQNTRLINEFNEIMEDVAEKIYDVKDGELRPTSPNPIPRETTESTQDLFDI